MFDVRPDPLTLDPALHTPLSIATAAQEAPARIGLICAGRRYTFAELAGLAAQRAPALAGDRHMPYPCVADNTLDTVLTLYALLEMQRPVLLLHPKLTAGERQTEVDATAHAGRSLPADAAAVLYTSGTSGHPRGAVLARSAFIASAAASAANLGWEDDDCWLLAMPLARVGGLSILTRCLAARRTVALASHFDAATLPQQIDAQRITLLSVVPTMLSMVLDAHPDWRAPAHLRAVLVGGAAASPRLLARAAERGLPVVITYGCTETCSQIVATPYAGRRDTARHAAGRPLAGTDVRVVDGRIQARGPMRMAGYLGEPPLPADAWFDTGDLGEFDGDGCLHVHAREGDLIVTGGENVYPAEVERVLGACPGIAEAAVFGLPDETWGQVVAAALVATEAPPSDAALAAFIDTHLARHKQPRWIGYLPSLPHTAGHKLDRQALSALAPALRPLSLA